MRRASLSFFLALQCLMASAVDYHTAKEIASHYVDLPETTKTKSPAKDTTCAGGDYYIFNDRVKGNGFVIVSGKDDVNPVLGYSDRGYADMANLPAPLRYFLANADATSSGLPTTEAVSAAPAQPVVEPLIKTQWYQLEPYNAKSPGPDFLTGCVATGMAQVMNYHQWPERGHGQITYNSYGASDGGFADPVGVLSYDLSQSVYDWDNMLPTYRNGEWNDAQADAVSTLMRDCGYAAHMLYRTSESSSFDHDAATGLVQNFGYDAVAYPHYGTYDTRAWMSIMKNEFDNGFPVIMLGKSGVFGGDGHCFIADGYDSEDYIHINWGWNGEADGYYNLGALTPVHGRYELNYSYMQTMITAHPRHPYSDAVYNPWLSMLWDVENMNLEHSGLTVENPDVVLDSNTPGRIRIDGLTYICSYPVSGIFKLVLTDASGAELKTAAQCDFDFKGLNSKDDSQLVDLTSISVDAAAFDGVADGNYRLIPMTAASGMAPQRVQGYGYKNYVNVNITDGKVRLSNVPKPDSKISLDAMMSVQPQVPLFSTINGEIEISNRGDFIQSGNLEIYADAQDGSEPVRIFVSSIALYENQSLKVPVNIEVLPQTNTGYFRADQEYALIFKISDEKGQPVELDNQFDSPRFKVVYDPEYLPTITIASLKITDDKGNEVEKDASGVPQLDINSDYCFTYSLKAAIKGISPTTFHTELAGEKNETSFGANANIHNEFDVNINAELSLYGGGLPTGENYMLFSHSDFINPQEMVLPQPENLSRYRVNFMDSSAGIDCVAADGPVKETGRYNLQGIKVPAETKGIVIIKYNDGSHRKVLIN